jgi:hypothetical protein
MTFVSFSEGTAVEHSHLPGLNPGGSSPVVTQNTRLPAVAFLW